MEEDDDDDDGDFCRTELFLFSILYFKDNRIASIRIVFAIASVTKQYKSLFFLYVYIFF